MSIPVIVVTKIDHDSWLGYYIGDRLYGYNDYYNFSDDEVKKEAILQAIDDGILKNRKDPHEIRLEYHTDWPEYTSEAGEEMYDVFSSHLPESMEDLKQWLRDRAN